MNQHLVLPSAILFAGLAAVAALAAEPTPSGPYAEENNLYPWEAELIEGIAQAAKMPPAGDPCKSVIPPLTACAQVSDRFCERLWDPANKGNMTVGESKFLVGRSSKSDLSMANVMDLQALLDSEPRLPPELRARVSPILAKLREHMGKEEDSRAWYRQLGDLRMELDRAMTDLGEEDAEMRNPELKRIKARDLTIEQRGRYSAADVELHDAVLRAKYESHPNWRRVERVFEEVRKDLSAEIATMNVSEELRQEISQKLATIKLSLPFRDPRLLEASSECGQTEENAFYLAGRHLFTVCAGYFNGYQDESVLYVTLAHEIAHSFDPKILSIDRMMRSDAGKIMAKMCNSQGPAFSCEEWLKIRSTAFAPLPEIPEPNPPYRRLTSCLKPEGGLKPFETSALVGAAEEAAAETMDAFATDRIFSFLAQPTTRGEDGVVKPNELYFRPDRLRAKWNAGIPANGACLLGVTPELAVQSLECQGYRQATLANRKQVFDQALTEVEDVRKAIQQRWYATCGRDCPDLSSKRLGRAVGEDFADWMAARSLVRRIQREPSIAKRRHIAAAGGSDLCDSPSPLRDASDLGEVEKRRSFVPHPERRMRRLRLFTPKISKLVHCAQGENNRGDVECEL